MSWFNHSFRSVPEKKSFNTVVTLVNEMFKKRFVVIDATYQIWLTKMWRLFLRKMLIFKHCQLCSSDGGRPDCSYPVRAWWDTPTWTAGVEKKQHICYWIYGNFKFIVSLLYVHVYLTCSAVNMCVCTDCCDSQWTNSVLPYQHWATDSEPWGFGSCCTLCCYWYDIFHLLSLFKLNHYKSPGQILIIPLY